MEVKNTHQLRTSCQNLILSFIKDEALTHLIEKAIYNHTINNAKEFGIIRSWNNTRFCEIYQDKARQILINLDKDSHVENYQLIDLLKKNKIEPSKICSLEPQDLFPDVWKEIIEEKKLKENVLKQPRTRNDNKSIQCYKCKSFNIQVTTAQTRSADEGTTIFYTCECGNRWKT